MNDIILKAENLFYTYDDGKSHSLNGLSLEIRRGKKIAVMGPNGSGKSTFFLCCNGVYRPASGTVYFHGEPVDYTRKGLLRLRQKVGIVFQDPDNQLFSASVCQEIAFGLLNLGIPEQEARQEVEKIMEEMEISSYRDRPTHALSGGQKKQVSIADILVMKPEIVILDEPAAALDPRHTELVNRAVDRMTRDGITVMMATHDVDHALEWADEVIVFRDGKAEAHGTPRQIFRDRELLKKANLPCPTVLKLTDALKRKGILKKEDREPDSMEELLQQIHALSPENFSFSDTAQ